MKAECFKESRSELKFHEQMQTSTESNVIIVLSNQ
jgi:hypothetical protein